MIAAVASLVLPGPDTSVRAAAQLYARAGFAPVPVHGLRGSECACGRSGCEAIGKHPVGASWQKRAAADVDTARELFAEHDGNIGIVVGDGLVVIDIDDYHGGRDSLAGLPAMPPTLTSRSGSGQGEHRIFRLAQGQDAAEITNRPIADGIDIKVRGGQIVVAPSMHRSGNRYEWIDTSPPSPLPDDLYERIRKRRVVPIRATPSARTDALSRRAERYLAKLPAAVSGQGGHPATFAAARACWGWVAKGLPESEAWALLCAYNERCQPPWTEAELRHKWDDASRAERIPVIEDRDHGPPPPPAPPSEPPPSAEPDWRALLLFRRVKSGPDQPRKHHENAVVVLRYHPAWSGPDGKPRLRFDEHAQRTLVLDPPWHSSDAPASSSGLREWTDADDARLSAWICREVSGLELSVSDCFRAVRIVAEANPVHPFREYLAGLRWDGTERLAHWLSDHLEAPDSPYVRLVGAWWLISAAARTFRPGCKVDHVLILEGAQGVGKSAALRILAGDDFFRDTPIDLRSKDAFGALRGKVIVELAELESLRKADADRAKAFFTSPVDDYRAAYERREVRVPRGCVFAGTVNHASYLTDDTGGRRYWPVRCGRVNTTGLAAARDQLWAEAAHRFHAGERWWPEGDEVAMCMAEQAPRAEGDSWEDAIQRYVTGRSAVTVTEILGEALKLAVGDHDRGSQMRVARLLAQRGWTRRQVRTTAGRVWTYEPPPSESGQ